MTEPIDKKELKMKIKEILEDILPHVQKPITYTGNEVNAVHKNLENIVIRYAMAFPDTYEVGMSHLGIKILYALLNEEEDIWCERVFAPWIDMEAKMRSAQLPLYTLESTTPLKEMDFIGFTLQYEMSYTNILNMLDLAQIPLLCEEREESDPIVMAGGPCAYNPEPLADFIDIFVIGEAEESLPEIMEKYRNHKKNGGSKKDFFQSLTDLEGVYVPAFYDVQYHSDGTIAGWTSTNNAPFPVKKRFIHDMEHVYYPDRFVVPYAKTIHDRVNLEVFRGCGRGCRFCQAGIIYRPTREKSVDCVMKDAENILKSTGYDEVTLSSLSTGDYTGVEKAVQELLKTYDEVGINLPSLRIDSLSVDLLEDIQKVRKTGITLAPEAGTQRLRDVINKGVTEADLISTVTAAFEKGWGHIKLYFVIGLPTETEEDLDGIADLAEKVIDAYFQTNKELRNRRVQLVISTACLVPKPFTPFQWMGQDTVETFNDKQNYLKKRIKNRKITYNWHDATLSYYEAVFARGDRRLGKVLLEAHRLGCKFDSWAEVFDDKKWQRALEQSEIHPDFYAHRERDTEENLPWDIIDVGVSKEFLISEWQKSLSGEHTPYCKEKCSACGIADFAKGYKCHEQYHRI